MSAKCRAENEKRIPQYSRNLNLIPQLYVPGWQTDMKNRKLILENAKLGGVPHYEHDEHLYLNKREQMHYNVEDIQRVQSKYKLPARSKMLRPEFSDAKSRYQSSLMQRRDNPDLE